MSLSYNVPIHALSDEHRPLHTERLRAEKLFSTPARKFSGLNWYSFIPDRTDCIEHFCVTLCCIGRVQTVKALVMGATVVVAGQMGSKEHTTGSNTPPRRPLSKPPRSLTLATKPV